ncbi:F390 synthetase-related protein [Brevifollis gellanilyticus]|uniref:F390 synthetase-related protein n=1 Tax=Brevifollis gellanilyticus TaxID=748831 RepID=UPI0014796CC9|nr:F390 synthetase-related protein [Brevifollis gellanilyticus]
MIEPLHILWHFVRTRWLPSRCPHLKLRRFLEETVRECRHYQGLKPELEAFPIVSKRDYLSHFAPLNRHGITLEEATSVALRAEKERDFKPQLPKGITIGLSSGTSGARHVFLVGPEDRCRWAGQMLARMLSTRSLQQLANPFRAALRIAFFLRANSNLYTTLRSRRVQFSYYDLTRPFASLLDELTKQQPHILVAPATVLAEIARQSQSHSAAFSDLQQIISVAEVLDSRDRSLIEEAFHLPVEQIYQATEGFLGATCRHGRIHLNEDDLHIEKQWLDERRDRFEPVITDFSRRTQWFVRHRLTDILRPAKGPCPCGSTTTSLDSIEGRAEEVLWCRDAAGKPQPVFPDVLRQALYSIPQALDLYRIEQHGEEWRIHLRDSTPVIETAVRDALTRIIHGLKLSPPILRFLPWTDQPPEEKQKRLRCITPLS